jgi:uncharacterized protein (TIGR02271 family)
MQGVSVVREDGTSGTVVADAQEGLLVVEFKDGSRVSVTPEALLRQGDGSYRLTRVSERRGAEAEEVVIPVVAEELIIETHRVARGKVRVHKRVETRNEVVDAPTIHEEVVVEHIPINKFVEDVVPEVRDEDGVLIIPVVEEILVTEKRLFVREEVRVHKRRTTTSTPQSIVLRREVIEIEREDIAAEE